MKWFSEAMAVRLRTSLIVLFGLLGGIILFCILYKVNNSASQEYKHTFKRSAGTQTVNLQNIATKPTPQNSNCTYHTCVNVFHCGYNDNSRISVYVYPVVQYMEENGQQVSPILSREFHEILETIWQSPYHTENPDTACLFIPPFDVLNQNNVRTKDLGKLYTLLNW